jgi:hypothetical protein
MCLVVTCHTKVGLYECGRHVFHIQPDDPLALRFSVVFFKVNIPT